MSRMDRYSEYITAHAKPRSVEDPDATEFAAALVELDKYLEQQHQALDESTQVDEAAKLTRVRAALRTAREFGPVVVGTVGGPALATTAMGIGPAVGAATGAAALAVGGAHRDIAKAYRRNKEDVKAGRPYNW